MGEDGAEGLDPSHPVVRHEIVQERAELDLPVLGCCELPEALPVRGELVELLPVDPLGEFQVWGPGGDLVLLASDTEDRVPIRLPLDADQGAIAPLADRDPLDHPHGRPSFAFRCR